MAKKLNYRTMTVHLGKKNLIAFNNNKMCITILIFVRWRCVKIVMKKLVDHHISQASWWLNPPPPLPRHTLWSTLNDVCCSFHALMCAMAVLCSMWQMIRHANQAEAAVESLIIVLVPHKGPSPACTDPPPKHPSPFTSTPIPLQPSYTQTDRWARGWSTGRRVLEN